MLLITVEKSKVMPNYSNWIYHWKTFGWAEGWEHRRRIKTEEKAKVVAAV